MVTNTHIYNTPWGAEVKADARPDTNDWNTLYSCLTEDEYAVGKLPQGDFSEWCFDIGGHIGGCTLALLSRGYNVIVVEPLPENVEIIKRNAELNNWSLNILIFENAISDVDNEIVEIAYGNTNSETGRVHHFVGVTLLNKKDRQDHIKYIPVKTVSINTIFKNIKSSPFLKIDCEGAEWGAFEKVDNNILSNIKMIAAELHPVGKYMDNLWGNFLKLLGKNYQNITQDLYGDTFDGNTIGLAFYLNNEYTS